jgi:hypothetical protein
LATETRRTEAQALEIGDASQFIAEPATGLGAGIAGEEALEAELVVDLVPDFLAAEVTHPCGKLAAGHAIGHAREEAEALALVLPVVRGAVAHFGRTIDHRIERLQARYHFAGSKDLNGQAAAGSTGDAIGKVLGANPEAGKVLWPGRDHAPGDVALAKSRGRQRARRCRTDSCYGSLLEEFTSFQFTTSQYELWPVDAML